MLSRNRFSMTSAYPVNPTSVTWCREACECVASSARSSHVNTSPFFKLNLLRHAGIYTNLSPQIRTERPPAEARGCRMARTVRCHRAGLNLKKKRPVTPVSTFTTKRIVEVEVAGDIDDTGTGTRTYGSFISCNSDSSLGLASCASSL
jgi:hypothetical protein